MFFVFYCLFATLVFRFYLKAIDWSLFIFIHLTDYLLSYLNKHFTSILCSFVFIYLVTLVLLLFTCSLLHVVSLSVVFLRLRFLLSLTLFFTLS